VAGVTERPFKLHNKVLPTDSKAKSIYILYV